MEKTILVTGKETFLGSEISRFFLNQGCKTAVSIPSSQEGYPDVAQDRAFLAFPWNKRSSISAKNFILQTQHDLGPIDEAWLIFSLDHPAPGAFPELTTSELEEALDHQIKGFLFLTRELLALQGHRPELRLHFLFQEEARAEETPLEALQYHGLRAFVSSLLDLAKKKNLPIWAFENLDGTPDAFVQYVLNSPKTAEGKHASHGKWQTFQTKKNPFQNLFRPKD